MLTDDSSLYGCHPVVLITKQTTLIHVIMWNVNLMQQGNFIDVFLSRRVSGTYAHHQEH